jgi:hypothetical protein
VEVPPRPRRLDMCDPPGESGRWRCLPDHASGICT